MKPTRRQIQPGHNPRHGCFAIILSAQVRHRHASGARFGCKKQTAHTRYKPYYRSPAAPRVYLFAAHDPRKTQGRSDKNLKDNRGRCKVRFLEN
jgi:hypothetical protein